jgi:hypothetical protein
MNGPQRDRSRELVMMSATARTSKGVDKEVLERCNDLMRVERLQFSSALKVVLASDTGLCRRYREAHQLPLPEDAVALPLKDRSVEMRQHHAGWDSFWKAYRASHQ